MFSALAGRSKQLASSSVCQELRSQLFNNASPSYVQIRTATKRGGGSTKNGRDSAGRRLGVKKYAGEYVIPGNVIVRQRGRKFHPGQSVIIGRDHTLIAKEPGYVVFYEHHIKFPHQAPSKLHPPVALDVSKPGKIDDGSKPVRDVLEEEEFAPVKLPRNMKRYVGIVRNRDDVLPRDQREEGRERRFWMTEKSSSEPAWRRLL